MVGFCKVTNYRKVFISQMLSNHYQRFVAENNIETHFINPFKSNTKTLQCARHLNIKISNQFK